MHIIYLDIRQYNVCVYVSPSVIDFSGRPWQRYVFVAAEMGNCSRPSARRSFLYGQMSPTDDTVFC